MAKEFEFEGILTFNKKTSGTVVYESEIEINEEEVQNIAEASEELNEEDVREMLKKDEPKVVRPIYIDKEVFELQKLEEDYPEKMKIRLEEVE